MRPTVLFVHGTGVRADRYADLYRDVERGLAERPVDLAPCYWGGHGVAELEARRSIPDYPEPGEVTAAETSAWNRAARWSILDLDPLHELAVLGSRAPAVVDLVPGHPGLEVKRDLQLLDVTPELKALLTEAGLADHWDAARQQLVAAPELERALSLAQPEAIPERQAAARALVALAQHRAAELDQPWPDPEDRDRIVAEVTRLLRADVAGWASDLLTKATTVALGGALLSMAPTATWAAARRRGAVADATAPLAGDVLLYQVRGKPIRHAIRDTIERVDGPVVLLAHSLGGIACVDLLFSQALPQVELLVTVGSQAPFLHELGALWSLEPGDGVPPHVEADWVNVYDRKDLLSFVAAGVFGDDAVTDVEIDNRVSFPRSHSRYFRNPDLWSALEEHGL